VSLLRSQQSYNGYVIHPGTGVVYLYDSANGNNIEYNDPVMDAKLWVDTSEGQGMSTKAASVQSDPLSLSDVFFDTEIPGTGKTAEDLAKEILQSSANARRDHDLTKAAAVITSKDFGAFQNLVILGETSAVTTRQGILTGIFQEIATPNLSGKWATFDDGVKFYTNVPEGTTVEPSGGTGSLISISVPKHEGAVAITYRAQAVINGDNPFARLTARLSQEAAKKENALVAAELESNTSLTTAGVDFGDRSGTPPTSDQNPLTLWNTLISLYDAIGRGNWNAFISKSFIFNEYITNDIVRGAQNPIPNQTNVNESSSSIPALPGVTWYRDNAISSSTNGWALDTEAIKIFRGPTTAYTVSNQDTETTKDVLRRYMQVETVDGALIYLVTDIAA